MAQLQTSQARTKRLSSFGPFALIAAVAAIVVLFLPFWSFSIQATSISVPAPGGGWTTIDNLKGASATLSGWDVGASAMMPAFAAAACGALTWFATRRVSWIPAAIGAVLCVPSIANGFIKGWERTMAVSDAFSAGAEFSSPDIGIAVLPIALWASVGLAAATILQAILVKAAVRAEEGKTIRTRVEGTVTKYVAGALERIGVGQEPYEEDGATAGAGTHRTTSRN